MQNVLILNTGGTFNKRYDPIAGELVVPEDDRAVAAALASMAGLSYRIGGLLYKDSLQMDDTDRAMLAEAVSGAPQERIVVVHGTDTMDRSAAAVAQALQGGRKRVVFTGAMVPFSIDPVEATANLVSAVTAVAYLAPGVHVAMHGWVLPHDRIRKNREKGIFERVEA
jgi:L-asparaginase